MQTMRAAVLHEVNKPLVIENVPKPTAGPGEVVVKIKASGICGSDLHIIDGSTVRDLPLIVGHECAGILSEIGDGVTGWELGDRVSVNCIITCGNCQNCVEGKGHICAQKKLIGHHFPGAYAEYVKVPAKNILRLPEDVSFELGAILTDAVATPFHAITKRAEIKLGESVAVFGLGGLGIHAVQLAKLAGAAQIFAVDTNEVALQRAEKFGAIGIRAASCDAVEEILKLKPSGVDVAMEFIGLPLTIDQAVRSLRVGGRVTVCGLSNKPIQTVDPGIFVRNEYSLIGSYGFSNVEIESLITLVQNKQLDLSGSVTKVITLDEVNEGVRQLKEKIDNPIRIVMKFD